MEDHGGLRTARLVAVGLLTAEVALLVATGLWLAFFYRPSTGAAWNIPILDGANGAVGVVRGAHRWAAFAAFPTSVAAAVLVVVDSRTRRGGWRPGRTSLAAGPALVILVLAATFTGYLLPWDQLALRAVTVGTNMRGYGPVFRSSVVFALVGGTEVARTTVRNWLLVHTVLLSALLAGALFVAWHPRRREPPEGGI